MYLQTFGIGAEAYGPDSTSDGGMLQCEIRIPACQKIKQSSPQSIHKYVEVHVSSSKVFYGISFLFYFSIRNMVRVILFDFSTVSFWIDCDVM